MSSLVRTGGWTAPGAVRTFASGFDNPIGLAFDSAGNLYVANSGNNTVSEVRLWVARRP